MPLPIDPTGTSGWSSDRGLRNNSFGETSPARTRLIPPYPCQKRGSQAIGDERRSHTTKLNANRSNSYHTLAASLLSHCQHPTPPRGRQQHGYPQKTARRAKDLILQSDGNGRDGPDRCAPVYGRSIRTDIQEKATTRATDCPVTEAGVGTAL